MVHCLDTRGPLFYCVIAMFDTWQTSTGTLQIAHFDRFTASTRHYLTMRLYIPSSESKVGAVVIIEFAPETEVVNLAYMVLFAA